MKKRPSCKSNQINNGAVGIGNSSIDESRISLKSVQGYSVNESMIAKIDRLEKEIIKKRYELQIVRKDLHTHLEKDQKEKLIHDVQKFGDNAVAEMIKAFKGVQLK